MKAIGTKTLVTPRLILRKIRKEDAASLFSVGSLGDSLQEAMEIVANMIQYNDDPMSFHWVLEYEGMAIGRMEHEGILKNHWIQSDGTYINVHCFGLLASVL